MIQHRSAEGRPPRRRQLRNRLKAHGRAVLSTLSDQAFALILLGVVGAAFVFAFVFKADRHTVVGVLLIGCVTAFLETSHRRGK
jgi:hypothetical protein